MMNNGLGREPPRRNVQRVAHTPTAAPSATCLQFHLTAAAPLPIKAVLNPATVPALLALITGKAKLSAVHERYVSEPERS